MIIVGTAISLIGLLVAYEVVRGIRITRKLDRLAKSGLSHRQLVARGMI